MDKRDFLNILDKSSVVIISKQIGNEVFKEIDAFIVKPSFTRLEIESEGKLKYMPFAGISEGIYQIRNGRGTILYENKKVLDNYLNESSTMTQVERWNLETQGEFFPN